LLRTAEEAGIKQRIVSTVVEVNDRRKEAMADRVKAALGGSVEGKRIGILGLTFKPNTDDMRDAPSIPLINGLLDAGASIIAYDPVGREQAEKVLPKIDYAASEEEAADGADALVIVTEWDEFRALDLDDIARRMRGKVLVDLRNVYNADEAEQSGLVHFGVGRGRNGANSR
jgi:UDPglucose 6-dehydrogenase